MTPELRAKAIQTLKNHARFDDHFTQRMPAALNNASEDEKNAWVFAHAAIWPDQVKRPSPGVTQDDVKNFNRSRWHYINMPVYLNEAERVELQGDLLVNLNQEVPAGTSGGSQARRGMNIIQALKFAAIVTKDEDTRPVKKATYLCWLIHLAGDAHQPLHSSAFFTTQRFESGDLGGNNIFVREQRLHSVWDGLLQDGDTSFSKVQERTKALLGDGNLLAAGKQASESMEFEAWLNEGHRLAKEFAYTGSIRNHIASQEGTANDDIPSFDPGHEYYSNAVKVAEQRGVEGGFRLAKMLSQVLSD